MRVCIPAMDPGGPDGIAAPSFEETETFDFYDFLPDGSFEMTAQTRPCACWGPDQAEAVSRRGIDAVIVGGISPNALLRFRSASVRVLRVNDPSIAALLVSFFAGKLEEIGYGQVAVSRKKKMKGN